MSLSRAGAVALLGVALGTVPVGSGRLAAGSPVAAAPQEAPAKGRLLFFRYCRECHSPPAAGTTAPDLAGLFEREGRRALTEDSVRRIVLDGRGGMQGFRDRITEEQLRELIAYLKRL